MPKFITFNFETHSMVLGSHLLLISVFSALKFLHDDRITCNSIVLTQLKGTQVEVKRLTHATTTKNFCLTSRLARELKFDTVTPKTNLLNLT